MDLALVIGIVVAIAGGLTAVVVAIVVVGRGAQESGTASDVQPGSAPFEPGPAGPELLERLGLRALVRQASGTVSWRVGGHDVFAARTDGRGWATSRGAVRTSATISGVAYTLVAVSLPGRLPTVNVLRDGVIGSDVDVESGAFNQARDIRTDDDRVAHAVLTPRVIALLQDLPEDLTVQIVGDHLVSFRRGVPQAAEVQERAGLLVQVADAIPRFVFEGPAVD